MPTLLKTAAHKTLPFAISVIALAVLISVADLSAFRGLVSRVQWDRLPLVAVLIPAIVVAFGWRWRTLLHESLLIRRAVLVSALGLSGNQVLPLRGGDALRVLLSARGQQAPSFHASVSALALEKLLDLLAVAALGLIGTTSLMTAKSDQGHIDVIVVAVAILAAVAAALLAARAGLMIKAFRSVGRLMRMPIWLYRHLLRPLHHLRRTVAPARVGLLLLETGAIWIALYLPALLLVAQLVSVPLGVADAVVLLFAAAIGVAIPAAPSALGTFHAAIVSAFVLLGRPVSDGLVLAVAFHGVFFIGLCVCGAIAIAIASQKLSPVRVRRDLI